MSYPRKTFANGFTPRGQRDRPEDNRMTALEERIERLRVILGLARECGDNELYDEIWDEIHALER